MRIRAKVEGYLKERFGDTARLMEMTPLGEGVHGTASLLRFQTPEGERHLIMKTVFPSRFGHDHYADRAQVLLLAGANYNDMPKHIHAVDVVGETPTGLISLGEAREFYIFMEEAGGVSYFRDLDAILERGALTPVDRDRALKLAHFLSEIHGRKYEGEDAGILYRRRIRDLVGHGECVMGIIDTYEDPGFTNDEELVDYASACLGWWGRIRHRMERLSCVHGDFHPGNIRIHEEDFTLLDRSRGSWGEPADDVSCLAVNYIYYAIMHTGTFEGPFAELLRVFLDHYMEKTADRELFEVIQPFFAFRVLVLAHPRFYPSQSDETRRKLFDFGRALLAEPVFRPDRISSYLERE